MESALPIDDPKESGRLVAGIRTARFPFPVRGHALLAVFGKRAWSAHSGGLAEALFGRLAACRRKADLEACCNFGGPEVLGRQASRGRVNGGEKVAPRSADLHTGDGQRLKGCLDALWMKRRIYMVFLGQSGRKLPWRDPGRALLARKRNRMISEESLHGINRQRVGFLGRLHGYFRECDQSVLAKSHPAAMKAGKP